MVVTHIIPCTSLQELDLSYNQLQSVGLSALAGASDLSLAIEDEVSEYKGKVAKLSTKNGSDAEPDNKKKQ